MPAIGMVSIAPMPCGASSRPASSVRLAADLQEVAREQQQAAEERDRRTANIVIDATRQVAVAEQPQVEQRVLRLGSA